MYLNRDSTVKLVGPSGSEKLSVVLNGSNQDFSGSFSGNMDIVSDGGYTRFYRESDFVGTVTANNNIYFGASYALGREKSNTISLKNGVHICTQGNANAIIPNDIVLSYNANNGSNVIRVGWNKITDTVNQNPDGTPKEPTGRDYSSLTFTGDISGNGSISFSSEECSSAIYLRGNNTFTGNSTITFGYQAALSLRHRVWFGVGSDTAFSTASITANTDIPTTVFDLETDIAGTTRTLNNEMIVAKNSIQFTNTGHGDGFINSTITGDSTNPIEFGTIYAEENVGGLFFNGTTTKTGLVNAGMTLGGTGEIDELTVSNGATLYVSNSVNGEEGNAFTIANALNLNGTLEIDLEGVLASNYLGFLEASETVLGDDAAIRIRGVTQEAINQGFTLSNVGAGLDAASVARVLSVLGDEDDLNWAFAVTENGLFIGTPSAVPEPSAWVLLCLGVMAVPFMRRCR